MKHLDVFNGNTALEFTKFQKVLTTKITSAQERVEYKQAMKSSVKKGEEIYLTMKPNKFFKFEMKRICAYCSSK